MQQFISAWNERAQVAFDNAAEKGFHERPLNVGESIALIHSELSEALEADRKALADDKLPHRPGLEVELADAVVRIMHLGRRLSLDVAGAIVEKMAFNTTRPKMHGGKSY